MDFKKLKNKKGITLIALAVTIVVLLILAGVTISSVFSENGIINKALQAQNTVENATEKDIYAINELEKELTKYQGTNVNSEDYETLTLKTYVGRFQRQCVNYLRAYVEIYDLANEENSIKFNIGTDWEKHIDKTKDTNNLFLIDSNTNLQMIQNTDNLKTYEYNTETKVIDRNLLTAFTDVEITFKAKKNTLYGIKVVAQSADASDNNNILIKYIDLYKSDWGENNSKTITRTEVVKQVTYKMYDITNSSLSTSVSSFIKGIAAGDYGLSVYSFKFSDIDTKYALKLLNETGNGAIDERYIGIDFNRDGYIDEVDASQIMIIASGKGTW